MSLSTRLAFTDHRAAPDAWASALGISRAAIDLYLAAQPIDLHVDSFIWQRILGYDLRKRHGHGALGARFYSQVDLPRLREAQVAGAVFVISTNPLRSTASRPRVFAKNFACLKSILASVPEDVQLVRTARDFADARAQGKLAAFIGIQGGNAIDRDGEAARLLDDGLSANEYGLHSNDLGAPSASANFSSVVRVTLVHLSNSRVGGTSAPLGGNRGLTEVGRQLIASLNARRIFVDLAHISKKGFWEALEVHDKTLPAIVTHTGVSGVHEHWRNLDDEQVRAIAKSGGVVGVMYQSSFLGDPIFSGRAESIVRHLEHIAKIAGDDTPALGSDWDGAIVPPLDMKTCLELPRLVQIMLDRGWREERITRVLSGNFLRALTLLRG
jgi:membrane dipeptidase